MQNIIDSEFSTEYKLKAVRNESFDLNKIVNNHNQSELILRSLYEDSIMIYESFFVLFLDNSLRVKGFLKCYTFFKISLIINRVIAVRRHSGTVLNL